MNCHTKPDEAGFTVGQDVTERKRAEAQLRFQARLLNTVGQAVIATDMESRITYWNRAAEALYGWKAAEVMGRRGREIIVPSEIREEASEIVSELRAGKSWSGKFLMQRRDGTVFPAQVTNEPIYDENEVQIGVIGVSSDITERKSMEESLQRERDFISTVLDTIGSLVLVIDRESHIIRFNRACEQASGYTFAEVQGKRFWDLGLLAAEEDETVQDHLAQLCSGKLPGQLENYWIDRQGNQRLISWSNTLLLGTTGEVEYVIGTGSDITGYRDAVNSLRESEERFRQMAENADEVFWLTNPTSRQIYYVSPAYERIWGRSTQSLYDRPDSFAETIHPEDWPKLQAGLTENSLQGGFDLEYRITRPDGTLRWVWDRAVPIYNEQGDLYRIAGVAQDITERKQAEVELAASQERLQIALNDGHIGLWDWDIESGTVEYSAQWKSQLGYDDHEISNSFVEWQSRIHPDDLPSALLRVQEYSQPGRSNYRNEFRIRHKDGTYRWMLAQATVFAHADGKPHRMLGSHIDLTERKLAEEELSRSREELRALMAHLETAIEAERTHIAREIHDHLGQELTSLKIDLGWLSDRLPVADKTSDDLAQKIKTMSQLVDGTIQAVRQLATELRPAMLDDLGLEPAIEWQVQNFQDKTGISAAFTAIVNEMKLNREQATAVFRVLQEALTNVARHSEATHVDVRLRQGTELTLEVIDDGRGITANEIDHPHSLGLIGMRERARLLGGDAQVEGAAGGGTAVILRIPVRVPE